MALKDRVTSAFASAHGHAPMLVARAPGRVNLIGEHTDYNDGFVLPCAIGPSTMVAASPRADREVRIVAADFDNAVDTFNLDTIVQSDQGWANYVRGTVDALQKAGFALGGAHIAIAGNLPKGAGLSSSASLEVAVGQAMLALAKTEIDRTLLAQVAQAAECDFVGTKCGIMDQLISAQGKEGHALLIDCRNLALNDVRVPDNIAIVIVHSGVTRGLVEGHYNERRRQCEVAAARMGVTALRDAAPAMLADADLDPITRKRAWHVITENSRTLAAAEALAAADLAELGRLMAESHASMRDDFEITVPAIDSLVSLMQSAIGNSGGARMTGGGFGGACVAILPTDKVEMLRHAVEAGYRTPDGTKPLIMVERPGPGVALT
ncbi:MAG: galactokinase [Sphingomonadaceae bacterium]|nr:galactokinase [Sphingomonadaceae bacterium]